MVRLAHVLRSDVSLLRDYANGNTAAFESLYLRHKDGLFNFIYRSVARQAVAEEIAQDVWLALIKSASGYQAGAATFRTWLYTIARNKIADFYRRPVNQHHEDSEVDVDDTSAVAQVEQNLLVNQLLQALDQLPPEQREAFILQQEGFTAKEIAEITGASKEAVKSRLRYARSSTRAQLEVRA
jgi:RNA polymerase sigma-70 factor (ECF subfamily)